MITHYHDDAILRNAIGEAVLFPSPVAKQLEEQGFTVNAWADLAEGDDGCQVCMMDDGGDTLFLSYSRHDVHDVQMVTCIIDEDDEWEVVLQDIPERFADMQELDLPHGVGLSASQRSPSLCR
jgi:hypothetical protein